MSRRIAIGLIAVMALSSLLVYLPKWGRGGSSGSAPQTPPIPKPTVPQIPVPAFNADSAYAFVAKQVKFGPRVPNTEAHRKCAAWMESEFKRMGLTVIRQAFQAQHYKGGTFNGLNLIAQYKPELQQRILIAAHWDSRFQADKDDKDKDKPIDGADDGASGIGVMLEMARALQNNPVGIGVDFICFDLEDQGNDQGNAETWCLGSQYWARNRHKAGYMPYQAVLLDMVGGKDARFYKEMYSMEAAPQTVDKIWKLASNLGHGDYFLNERSGGSIDDHKFVIEIARIPMIDVLNQPNMGKPSPFPDYHHKHSDNLDIIDKNTLRAVGETMIAFIYQTYNGVL